MRRPSTASERSPSHDAVVYDDPAELARTIQEFAQAALDGGGGVILIAPRDQLAAVREEVRLAGADEPGDQAPAAVRCHMYEADEVVASLALLADPVDAFTDLLDHACRTFPPHTEFVHVYGCVVAGLWELGQLPLGLEIEDTYNRLVRDRPVAILCAYPATVVHDEAAFDAIRRRHSTVTQQVEVLHSQDAADGLTRRADRPPDEARSVSRAKGAGEVTTRVVMRAEAFPASIRACRSARHFVREAVEESGNAGEIADAAELICSELASNAVRHAHSAFTVRVVCDHRGVRVSVADEAHPSPNGPREGGSESFPVKAARGLGIVAALASDWGIDDRFEGKVVWAELEHELLAA